MNVEAFGKKVASVGISLQEGMTIVGEVISLIVMVEQAAGELKGDQKFAAVMAAVDTLLQQMNLQGQISKIKAVLGPMISLIVQIYNFLKLWPTPTPTPAAHQ
jgi:hypothetical protein